MDRRSSDNFRIALFIFGAVIIILASILVPLRMLLLTTRIFVWISVFVMYLVIATPFIAPLLHSDKLDALFTGGIIYAKRGMRISDSFHSDSVCSNYRHIPDWHSLPFQLTLCLF